MRKKWKILFFLYLMLYCKKNCHRCPKELIRQFVLHIDSRVRSSGRAKGWEWQICHPRHEFSVIARSEATKQSREENVHALDCFATLAMTDKMDCHDLKVSQWRWSKDCRAWLGNLFKLFDKNKLYVIIKKNVWQKRV